MAMTPSRMTGGLSQSSANSGIFFQGDSNSQSLIHSHLNPPNSISNTNLASGFGDVVLNSIGASSLVTDANSNFPVQRSASNSNSPMSFTSNNNISASGSSVEQAMNSQAGSQMGQRAQNSFIQDPINLSHLQKKPRLDIKQEDVFQQQVLQQLLQRQDSMQLQNTNPQLHAILQQQQRLRQQQMIQAMSPMQRIQLQQQQQQQQLRQQLQQQSMQQMAAMKNPYDTGGVCARRLMQYLYHQRQRPAENTIAYWRKFVAEYYAPHAKKRWCLSLYDNVGNHALGVFPQASMDSWHCDICGSKSGRGFEATCEVLPRLNEIKFGSGVIDELLFVDLPRERRFANGIMILEYEKAVQESVCEQLRVIREGKLRIVFTQELKILSWDFCARRHEELLTRRLVAPQVNQLLQVAQKCQSTLSESGAEGVSSQDLQTNSTMVVAAGRQLAKSLELQSLNDLGFSKRYVRCLQIAEVVNSMKDLVDFCRDNKVGPIEGLKSYPRQNPSSRIPMQRMPEMEQLAGIPGQPAGRNTINNLLSIPPGMNNHNNNGINNNTLANTRNALSGPAAAALALTNYQRQNSSLSSPQEASSSLNNSQSPLLAHQRSLSNNGPQQSPSLQQQMMHQLIQDANSNGPQKSPNPVPVSGLYDYRTNGPQKSPNPGPVSGVFEYGTNGPPGTPSVSSNGPGNVGPTLSKSNSFKSPSTNESSNSGLNQNQNQNQKAADLASSFHLSDDMVPDLPDDFADNAFFGDDLDDNLGFDWKA